MCEVCKHLSADGENSYRTIRSTNTTLNRTFFISVFSFTSTLYLTRLYSPLNNIWMIKRNIVWERSSLRTIAFSNHRNFVYFFSIRSIDHYCYYKIRLYIFYEGGSATHMAFAFKRWSYICAIVILRVCLKLKFNNLFEGKYRKNYVPAFDK